MLKSEIIIQNLYSSYSSSSLGKSGGILLISSLLLIFKALKYACSLILWILLKVSSLSCYSFSQSFSSPNPKFSMLVFSINPLKRLGGGKTYFFILHSR